MKIVENKRYEINHEVVCNYLQLSKYLKSNEYINGEDIYLVQIVDKCKISGDINSFEEIKKEGFVSKEDLPKVTENISKYSQDPNIGDQPLPPLSKKNNGVNTVYLVDRGFIEHYTKYGIEGYDRNAKRGEEKLISEYIVRNVFENITERSDNHIFIQLKESPMGFRYIETETGDKYLPSFYLSYIEGTIDNSEYKLEEFAEHLLNNFNIDFKKDIGNKPILNSKSLLEEKDLAGIIKSIPHYNQDGDRTETIEINYYPTKEETDKIIKANLKYGGNMWDGRQFIVREILGGKHFTIKPPEPEPQVKKNKFR